MTDSIKMCMVATGEYSYSSFIVQYGDYLAITSKIRFINRGKYRGVSYDMFNQYVNIRSIHHVLNNSDGRHIFYRSLV